MLKVLFEKIKQNKKVQYVFIGILVIVLLILLFFYNSNSTNNKSEENDAIEQYVKNLENKLEDILLNISGVGKVDVAISVTGSNETVLAMKTTTTENNGKKVVEESPLTINGKTVVLKELYPEITGVIIVCEGAKNISVINKVIQATESLLNIQSNKINILEMK